MTTLSLRRLAALAAFTALSSPTLAFAQASPSPATGTPAPAPQSTATTDPKDTVVQSIATRYWYGLFALEPSFATQAGLHEYDSRLDDAAPAHYDALLIRDRAFLAELQAVDPKTLSTDDALDRTLLVNAIDDDLLLTGKLATWRHNADGYVGLASGSVYSLIERPFAPAPVRLGAVIARERAIPLLLTQARANLTAVDATSAEIAEADATGAIDFLAHDVPSAFTGVGTPAQQAALTSSTAEAVAAMRGYAEWLVTGFVAHPKGTYAIGAAAYHDRLKYEEGIDLPLAEYLAIGQRAFDDTRARMVATAKQIDPNASVGDLVTKLSQQHTTAAGLLPAAADDLVALRAFVISHHIVTLPPNADIHVAATPQFERAFVEAQEDSPGPLERVATRSYYNVTPPDPHDPIAVQNGVLEALNDFERPITSAHEVYPGHYTNFVIDRTLPLSLTRRLATATSFVEGWAHYGEQMIVDEGWGDGDPRVRLMQLNDALLRNARFIVGVKLHTRAMTVAQAREFFQKDAFQSVATARAESRRGTQDATYGYYTLGKLEILKLRDDYRKKMGSAYSLQRFHDELLSRGDAPIPLLRPLILGASDDGRVLDLPVTPSKK